MASASTRLHFNSLSGDLNFTCEVCGAFSESANECKHKAAGPLPGCGDPWLGRCCHGCFFFTGGFLSSQGEIGRLKNASFKNKALKTLYFEFSSGRCKRNTQTYFRNQMTSSGKFQTLPAMSHACSVCSTLFLQWHFTFKTLPVKCNAIRFFHNMFHIYSKF